MGTGAGAVAQQLICVQKQQAHGRLECVGDTASEANWLITSSAVHRIVETNFIAGNY